jgi:hypothetical protein
MTIVAYLYSHDDRQDSAAENALAEEKFQKFWADLPILYPTGGCPARVEDLGHPVACAGVFRAQRPVRSAAPTPISFCPYRGAASQFLLPDSAGSVVCHQLRLVVGAFHLLEDFKHILATHILAHLFNGKKIRGKNI